MTNELNSHTVKTLIVSVKRTILRRISPLPVVLCVLFCFVSLYSQPITVHKQKKMTGVNQECLMVWFYNVAIFKLKKCISRFSPRFWFNMTIIIKCFLPETISPGDTLRQYVTGLSLLSGLVRCRHVFSSSYCINKRLFSGA